MAGVTPSPSDQIGGPPPARTGRRFALAGAVAAALAVGGVAVAQAAESPSGSPSASGSAAPSGSPAPSGSAEPGRRTRTPFLAGTVVSASGDTIVVTDRQGFQRTIRTSSSTEYADGLTATPAAGTAIVAEGTVAADKTSLAATRIAKLPDRAAGEGRGRPGHGPRGGGPGRPDPSDPATPSENPKAPGTPAPSESPSGSASPSESPSDSASPSESPSGSASPSESPAPSPSDSASPTPTPTG